MIIMDRVEARLVLVTWPADRDPQPFAQALLDRRVAACVSILPPMDSIYRWQGQVEQAREQQVIIKTTVAALPALAAHVRELHPYDVPEFLVLTPSAGAAAYVEWLGQETTAR